MAALKPLTSSLDAVDFDFDVKFVDRAPLKPCTFEELRPLLEETVSSFLLMGYLEAEAELLERVAREYGLSRQALHGLSNQVRRAFEADRLAKGLAATEAPWDTHYRYGLCLRGTGYELRPDLVGVHVAKRFDTIATRGIWPSCLAKDVFTGAVFVLIGWFDSAGQVQSTWLRRQALTEKATLLALPDAPIHLLNVGAVSAWLVTACQFLMPDRVAAKVATRCGWLRDGDALHFVMPGVGGIETVGPARAVAGSVEAWREGVALCTKLGQEGFPALAILGHGIASLLVELISMRNGVLGIVQKTSKGKTIVTKFMLSAFGDPGDLMLNASEMTACGFQDHAHARSGLPVFVDEMHTLIDDPLQSLSRYIYQMANGVRRVVSSKTKEAWGGDRRYGNYVYAAELTVLDALQTGALYRVIEIDEPPLATREQAVRLQAITRANYGVAAEPIVEALNARSPGLVEDIEAVAWELSECVAPGLKGDDAYVIAQLQVALEILAEAMEIDVPAEDVSHWLARRVAEQRQVGEDKATVAFRSLLDYVCTIEWPAVDETSVSFGPTTLAWRRANGDIDVNPSNEKVRDLLKPYGGERFAREWVRRGWLATQADGNPKIKRKGFGKRVWRVPATVIGEAVAAD